MTARRAWPLEATVALYVLTYLPNIVLTRLLATTPLPALGRPLTGLEILPATLVVNLVLTIGFVVALGWHRQAHQARIGRWRLPVPTRATALSGLATALVLFTVPLSFTFKGVSIPFIQLLMRGDIVIIAPLVDLLFGRRVHWWSWVALAMVAFALAVTLDDRGGLNLPPLAIATIALYTLGYFLRLAVMTKVAKTGDVATLRGYFVEEKLVALPVSLLLMALLSAVTAGVQSGDLARGFAGIWGLGVLWPLIGIGLTMTLISVLATVILLDPRENSFCVPMERAASLVAGVAAAMLMAWFVGQRMPRPAELVGAGILICAIVLLSLAPRFARRGT